MRFKKIYFVGIGGIGMSAIARFFLHNGSEVFGYDKTETELTKQLVAEGMHIHYIDDVRFIPDGIEFVVYTPAIPSDHSELIYFQKNGFTLMKRSEVLGLISREKFCLAVAGTHGKTTTTCLLTHLLIEGGLDPSAFLGGVSLSLGSNFVQGNSDYVVVEADEYDRSFLRLSPNIAVINSLDPDHLDIYGDEKNFRQGFFDFMKKVKPGGIILYNYKLRITNYEFQNKNQPTNRPTDQPTNRLSFGISRGDYRAVKVRVEKGCFVFDFKSPMGEIKNIKTMLPGRHNIENATVAIAVAKILGVSDENIVKAMANFKGIRRRFETIFKDELHQRIYIDDYAHHPAELEAAINAARELFPKNKLMGIFQPHLFTRTRDFQTGFISALNKLDELVLLDIYPAREKPIEGVTSEILFQGLTIPKQLVTKIAFKEKLSGWLKKLPHSNFTLMTLGAGDIDTFVPLIGYSLAGNH